MEYKVQLQFFEDDATGYYGLAHKNSIDSGFNAFFNGIGLFHDIMEHYFEGVHPNFSGKYAFNYGGEIAASGHSAWYIHGLGLLKRWTDLNSFQSIEDTFAKGVGMEDEISSGYTRFGNELLCKCKNVYTIHPNYGQFVYYHWDYWQSIIDKYPEPKGEEHKVLDAMRIRKSLSLRKLEALYGWGYYTAKKLVPMTDHNIDMIKQMYKDLEKFTKYNDPRELSYMFKYFTAYITPGKKFKYRFTVSNGPYEFDALRPETWYSEDTP